MANTNIEPLKFTFERVFDDNPGLANAGYGEEDVAAIRDEAYRAGFLAAQEEIEQQTANAMASIAKALGDYHAKFEERSRQLEQEAAGLALMTGRKLAATLMKRFPAQEIEALIQEALGHMQQDSTVSITLNDQMLELVQNHVEQSPAAAFLSEQIKFFGSPDVAASDCRIEWADGQTSRNLAALEREIDAILTSYFPDSGATGNPAPDPVENTGHATPAEPSAGDLNGGEAV